MQFGIFFFQMHTEYDEVSGVVPELDLLEVVLEVPADARLRVRAHLATLVLTVSRQ